MGSRLSRHVAAICVPDSRLPDAIESVDGTATGSSYTEAGPRPGVSAPRDELSRLLPVVSGAQGVDLELVTLKAGAPMLALSGGVEVGYRMSGEDATAVRGWCHPGVPLAWSAAVWSDANLYDQGVDVCVIPSSQKLVVTYRQNTALGDQKVRVFNPSTWTWGSEVDVANGSETDAILCLPNGRLLLICLSNAYRSDDDGATWTAHAMDLWGDHAFTSFDRSRMAYNNGSICLVTSASARLVQMASFDLLGTLEVVYDSDATAIGTGFTVATLPTGVFVVGYVRNSDDFACCRILPTAGSSFEDADVIVIRATASTETVVVADPDGLLWAYTTGGTDPNVVYLHVSVDGGRTWTECTERALRVSSTNADYLTNLAACSWLGGIALAHNWIASTGNEDGSVGVVQMGGWSSVTGYPRLNNTFAINERTGFGGSDARSWLPIELPGDSGLFTANGAGTQTLVDGGLTISTTANARYYTATTGAETVMCAIYTMIVVSGGSLTDDSIVFALRGATGAADFELHIHHTTTGFRVYDENGATTLATVTLDLTTPVQIAIRMYDVLTQDLSAVWYRRPGDPEWTRAWIGSLTNDTATPNATGQIVWGHFTSSTSESRWSYVAQADEGMWGNALTIDDAPALGRPVTNIPIPMPSETGDSGDVAWLSAIAGPGALGEIFDVSANHDHPIEQVLPTVSPSPDEQWRSTSTAEQVCAWDFGDETWIGDSVALVAKGANFRQATLESHNGAAWVSAGTLDLATGFTGLDYDLVGDTLVPASATTAGARWIQEGELAGGMVIVETGGGAGTAAFRVRWNTAGAFAPNTTTTPKVRILLEGDLTTADGSGQCDIVWPGGVLVVHLSSIARRRRWRWRIAASQATPDGYYRAGVLVPMAVRAIGQAPDWGWSRERSPNAETRRSRYGTSRVRRLGPPPMTWSLAWTDATDLSALRLGVDQPYLGSSVGLPLVASQDVAWLLSGLIDRTDSGAVPVVALAAMPDASGTITDPTLWHYGRMTSSVRQEHVIGDEGEAEVVRVSSIDIEGLV